MKLTVLFASCVLPLAAAFTKPLNGGVSTSPVLNNNIQLQKKVHQPPTILFSTPNDNLNEKLGGFTVKQRLREEVESPFRKVRLAFFGFSSVSAAVALYFSAVAALKANMGGFTDVPPLEDALQTCAINAAGAIGFAVLTARELKVGQANLERIAKGGLLARLVVDPASSEGSERRTLKEYRRASRVVIAAGGQDYINRLSMSLCSDQLADTNSLPEALVGIDIVIVPVLLNDKGEAVDTKDAWQNAQPGENDRNFDSSRANEVIAYPNGMATWNQYLKSDVDTAKGQGFDVLEKGITITVKKNGRILRRATGLPPCEYLHISSSIQHAYHDMSSQYSCHFFTR